MLHAIHVYETMPSWIHLELEHHCCRVHCRQGRIALVLIVYGSQSSDRFASSPSWFSLLWSFKEWRLWTVERMGIGLPSRLGRVHICACSASISTLHIVIFIVARCPKECTSACGVRRASISSGRGSCPACLPDHQLGEGVLGFRNLPSWCRGSLLVTPP